MPNSINRPKLANKARAKAANRARKGHALALLTSSSSTDSTTTATTTTIGPLTTKTLSKKRAKLNARNSRHLLRSSQAAARQQELLQDAVMRDLGDGTASTSTGADAEEALSATQRKMRARREAARIANQAALAMTAAGADLEAEGMEIESTGNGTTLGRPRALAV